MPSLCRFICWFFFVYLVHFTDFSMNFIDYLYSYFLRITGKSKYIILIFLFESYKRIFLRKWLLHQMSHLYIQSICMYVTPFFYTIEEFLNKSIVLEKYLKNRILEEFIYLKMFLPFGFLYFFLIRMGL